MERILLAADYINLYQLGIFIINKEFRLDLTGKILIEIFLYRQYDGKRRCFDFYLDESSVFHIFQNQIVTLSVDGNLTHEDSSTIYYNGKLFSHVLNTFTNVLHLKFYQSKFCFNSFVKFGRNTPYFSSNLVELHINVHLFDDLLYILDGRLNGLRRLFVHVYIIGLPEPIRNKRVSFEQKETKTHFLRRINSVEGIFVDEYS